MERSDARWTLDLELHGEEREAALREAREILDAWGLAMPAGDPLVLHFGLNDFRRIGEIEYWIVNDRDHRYCGKFLLLFDGQRCPLHRHASKHETFFIVKGAVDMTAGDERRTLRPGDALPMAPGTDHTFAAVGGPALVLEVSLPSVQGDNLFADARIGNGGVL